MIKPHILLAMTVILAGAVLTTNHAFAFDISNQFLIGESPTGETIYLEFRENTERELYSKTIITPNLESLYIELNNRTFILDEIDTDFESVVTAGGSIKVLSKENNFILYAHHLGENSYTINFYLIDGSSTHKMTYNASLGR